MYSVCKMGHDVNRDGDQLVPQVMFAIIILGSLPAPRCKAPSRCNELLSDSSWYCLLVCGVLPNDDDVERCLNFSAFRDAEACHANMSWCSGLSRLVAL